MKGKKGMLLAIDVGNTNIVLGVFRAQVLRGEWRIATSLHRTADEYGFVVRELLRMRGIAEGQLTGIILSSVVPPLTAVFQEMGERHFRCSPLVVTHQIKTGLTILYEKPADVGADRIVNAVAAYEFYGGPVIVVDFGTATTFDVISRKGEYLGGVISPGVMISAEALFHKAAKLPKVELLRPTAIIGHDTVSSIQSGIIVGHAGLVDEMVRKMKREMKDDPVVIATGGLAGLIVPETQTIKEVRPHLTLEGLRIIYERNRLP